MYPRGIRHGRWVVAGLLGMGTGCLNVRAPDVQVYAPSGGERPEASPTERYTAYGRELDKVLAQQSKVESELKKPDWEELSEELGDWAKHVRRLNGRAGSSKNPARMREYCGALLREIDAMRKAARARDASVPTRST